MDEPKVLAVQVDGKVRLTWQKPEEEDPFWLDFEFEQKEGSAEANTNTLPIPQGCTLYMDFEPSDLEIAVAWIVNGDGSNAFRPNDGWTKRSVEFATGDTLSIRLMSANLQVDQVGTISLHINALDGPQVAEAAFVVESPCFLTSTMVRYFNKKDGGIELISMRKLREYYKNKHRETLVEYHQVSLLIIQGIEQSGRRDYYYSKVKETVDKIIDRVANDNYKQAEQSYLKLYYWLKGEFYD